MLALIDADIVAYRAAASAEKEEESVALFRCDNMMQEISDQEGVDSLATILTGRNNFRKFIYPQYKANRVTPRPRHLAAVQQHLVDNWKAYYTDGHEADDEIGILSNTNTLIVSIDKDLRQLPGWHYNFVRRELSEVSQFEGLYNFYKQLLTGDRTDNIPGIYGIGPVSAETILQDCTDEEELFKAVFDKYEDKNEMLLYGQLLWILRVKGGIWAFPNFLPEEEALQHSTVTTQEEVIPSTELGGATTKSDGLHSSG